MQKVKLSKAKSGCFKTSLLDGQTTKQMPVFWCTCYQHKLIKLHILACLWILVIYDIHNTFTSIKLENYSSSVTVWSRSSHLWKSHLRVNVSPAKHLETLCPFV